MYLSDASDMNRLVENFMNGQYRFASIERSVTND
jgi:hypothetical protein